MIQGSETLKCVQVLTGTVLHFIILSVFQAMSFVAFIPPIPSSVPADGGVREQLHSLADYQGWTTREPFSPFLASGVPELQRYLGVIYCDSSHVVIHTCNRNATKVVSLQAVWSLKTGSRKQQQFQKSKKIGTTLKVMPRVSSYQRTRAFICLKFSSNKILNGNRVVQFCKIHKISHFPSHGTWVNGPFDSPQQSKPFSLEFTV